jgi:CHAT domain-containing protein
LLLGLEDPSIPHVTEEVRGIGRSLERAQVLTGPAASSEQLRARGGESSMIHIAAHGLFRADNPLFSALRLADGWLTVNEIYQLELGGSLVTLSSCETGVGQVATGDELIGLSRAFFHAGAPALVVSLWKVSDASTTELMQSFYENLRASESVAAALQGAQRDTMARFPHPYHWAAFQVTGNGQLKPVV